MARAFSMKDAAEQLEKLPALLTHEGEEPVVAIFRRGHPVLAVMPWDLYVGLLQSLVSLPVPEESASAQHEGIRALLADAQATRAEETPDAKPQHRQPSSSPRRRPRHSGHSR